MIDLQAGYIWVHQEGRPRLLRVQRGENADVKTSSEGDWISFSSPNKVERDIYMYGVHLPPEEIISELESANIRYRVDEERASILVSLKHFQAFMSRLVLERETLSDALLETLLNARKHRLFPPDKVSNVTKVKKHSDRTELLKPAVEKGPIALPEFSVHPGASIDEWGPMMQTAMVTEAFRNLKLFAHDCNVTEDIKKEYRQFHLLSPSAPFQVASQFGWPNTNVRILIGSNASPKVAHRAIDSWTLSPPSRFLIVDNYTYREVCQILLLALEGPQVAFFRSGLAPPTLKLIKRARIDLHKRIGMPVPTSSFANGTSPFSGKPRIQSPHGDWKNSPAVVAMLAAIQSM